MIRWMLCVGVAVAFLFAVVPFLSADVTISTSARPPGAVKPKPAETPEPASETRPAPIPKLSDADKTKAEKLIKELGSDDFTAREAAEEALKKMGVGVLPLLKPHVTSNDAEVAERASRIVEHLQDLLPAGPSKVKVTLSLDRKKYKIGETIRASVRFANRSKKAVLLPMKANQYPWHRAVNYVLTGPDGKAVTAEKFKGMIAEIMILRLPLVVQPNGALTQKVYLKLVKELPKQNPQFRRMPPQRQIQKRAQLQQLPARKAAAPAAAKEKDAAARPKVKPMGFLRDGAGYYHFALAKPGKYTLKFRFTAKAVKGQGPERAGGVIRLRGAGMQIQGQAVPVKGLGGQVFVFRGGRPGNAAGAKPVTGLLESNEVIFEIVK